MKQLRNAAILVGLAAYAIVFYTTPMPSLSRLSETVKPWWRGELVFVTMFRPDEWLLANWFGSPPQFSLDDRVLVLLGAGFILAWAAALGWLLLSICRVTRGLTRLETTVFSTAVGLNLLSTWTLAAGLFGQLGRLRAVGGPALLTFAAAAGYWYWRRRSNNRTFAPAAPATLGNIEDVLAAAAGQIEAAAAFERAVAAAVQPLPQRRSSSPQRRDQISPQQRAQWQRREMLVAAYRRCLNFVGRHWLWLGLPFVAAILLAAMLPPTEFDVCEYHLQAPKEFYQRGQIAFLPHNVYANMALGAEMLSLLGMTMVHDWWWGALVGKTVIAAFTPLCALGLLAAGRRFYSTSAGVVAALVYISIPWLTSTFFVPNVNVSSSGMIEGASACYLFLALYALLLSRGCATHSPAPPNAPSSQWGGFSRCGDVAESHPTALVALAGYLAGGAVATKYPAVLFVLVPMAIWTLFGRSWRKESSMDRPAARELPEVEPLTPTPPVLSPEPRTLNPLAALAVFLLAAALGCGLWFGKNWALTGNPTYPLMYGVFDGATWNADKEMRWNRAASSPRFFARDARQRLGRRTDDERMD